MLAMPLHAASGQMGSLRANLICALPAIDELARAWDADGGPALYLYDPRDQTGVSLSAFEGKCPTGPVSSWPSCVAQPSTKDAGISVTACEVSSGSHVLCPVFVRGNLELALVTAAVEDDARLPAESHLIDVRRGMVRISRALTAYLERSPLD